MNSKLIRTFMIAIIATMSLTFTSCVPDEPYNTPLLGAWELYYINDVEVVKFDVDKFHFYENGRGKYAYYDNYRRWVEEDIEWSSYGSLLTITFPDYKTYSMSYRVGRDGYLELFNSTLHGNGVFAYRPVDRSSK